MRASKWDGLLAFSHQHLRMRALPMPHTVERLTKELAVRKRLQEALLLFSRGVSARLGLTGPLESLAAEVTATFGTRRTSVWMHDRSARILSMAGSSDPRESAAVSSIPADDASIIARGLRFDRPELSGKGESRSLVIPLRGWRRALGTVVIEGEPREVDPALFVELATDLGRQLSVAVERILVLDEFLGDMNEQMQLRTRLAQAEKLAALGQFVAGIAHEINNPLQGVLGYAELMLGAVPGDSPQQADLRRIYKEAERAADIVRNLLVFTGSQRSPRGPVQIGQVVAQTVAIRQAAVRRIQIDIAQQTDADLPIIMGDARRLQQALLNILINAEQAIASAGDSGRILITVGLVKAWVTIRVEDTGPGIPADVLPKIFDPFFTTKQVGQGTGLGLAIVYGIIQDHGGVITAAGSPLGGARFTVQLPAE
jgi:signal transduction histidine kinase